MNNFRYESLNQNFQNLRIHKIVSMLKWFYSENSQILKILIQTIKVKIPENLWFSTYMRARYSHKSVTIIVFHIDFHGMLWTLLLRHHFDKETLFILYLHLIPFERGFGLANSAQYYFQKKISQLTLEEVVMLLAIASSPTRNSPFSHPSNAKKIQSLLMQKLKESNCL